MAQSAIIILVSIVLSACDVADTKGSECLSGDVWSAPEGYPETVDQEASLDPLPGSIADNLLWQPIPEDFDPFFRDYRSDLDVCPPAQWAPETEHEGVWFTIETTLCAYLTVGQPLQTDLKKGQSVRVRIWHYRITVGDGPATLQISLGCEADRVWSATLDIPTEKGGLIMDTWTVPRDYEAGEPIYYNVTNHGANSWGLIELAVMEPETE